MSLPRQPPVTSRPSDRPATLVWRQLFVLPLSFVTLGSAVVWAAQLTLVSSQQDWHLPSAATSFSIRLCCGQHTDTAAGRYHYSIHTNRHRPTPTPTQTLRQPRQAAAEKIIVSRIIEVGARSAAGRDTDWNARLGQHVVKRQTRLLSQERFLKPSEHRSSFFWLSATEDIYGSGGTRSRRFSQFDYTSHTSNEQCAA